MRLNLTNTQTAHEGLPTGASNAAKMQTITSCLPNQVGIFYGCQGMRDLNPTHPAKGRQASKPHKRVSFKRTSPLTHVLIKPNEQCREFARTLPWRGNAPFEERGKNGLVKPNEQCREFARTLSWRQDALFEEREKNVWHGISTSWS